MRIDGKGLADELNARRIWAEMGLEEPKRLYTPIGESDSDGSDTRNEAWQ